MWLAQVTRRWIPMGNAIFYTIEHSVASGSIPAFDPSRPVLRVDPAADGSTVTRHSRWSSCLKRHLSDAKIRGIEVTVVDYSGMSADPDFERYLSELAAPTNQSFTPNEELATWINAYNALCIRKLIRHRESTGSLPASVNDLSSSEAGPIWDQKAGVVNGVEYSLSEIEHQHIRRRWDAPLMHACLVCASVSCPDLRREAFEANTLETQMKDSFAAWMRNTEKGMRVEAGGSAKSGGDVMLSRIFLWFQKDFGSGRLDSLIFVRDNLPPGAAAAPPSEASAVDYFAYDWGINAKPCMSRRARAPCTHPGLCVPYALPTGPRISSRISSIYRG